MRLVYDPDADAALLYLVDHVGPGGAPRSLMCELEMRECAVILLLDEDGRLVGLELLGASRLLPKSVLASAPRTDRA